jgi:hypothetical protein
LTPKIKEDIFMTYEIRYNSKFNSHEVYFDGKPSEEVRQALKDMRFRWHSVNKCWYGYNQSEESIAHAITAAGTEEEPASVFGDGYLGGGAIYGSKSHKHLYGADLSAAVRGDLKKAGIKGATCKIHSYAGGQSLTVTLRVAPSDFLPFDQYLEGYRIKGSQSWIYMENGEYIHCDKYWGADGDEQERIRISAARRDYGKVTTEEAAYRLGWIDFLTAAAKKTVERIDSIVSAYRYDCSNGMVDYFDTNFYYDIRLKPVAG